jgi:hypothetical protein
MPLDPPSPLPTHMIESQVAAGGRTASKEQLGGPNER